MSDKPFDPDKTMADMRRPEEGEKPAETPGEERTVVMTRPPAAASGDLDKTIVGGAHPSAADADKTIVGARRPGGGGGDLDRTIVGRPGSGPAAAPSGPPSGFEVIVLSGQARGRRFSLPEGEALIGSNTTCQVSVPGIESVHAKFAKQGEGFEIQNLGSEGSLVTAGGRHPQRAQVKPGDLFKVGEVVMRFVKSGEVFSSEYSDAELEGSALSKIFDPKYRLYLIIGGAVVVVLLVLLWPSSGPQQVVVKKSGNDQAQTQRNQQVNALLASGEVLFNEGRLIAPADQPDAESAFSKFNEVLALSPGNEKALAWLKRIDEERDKDRKAREAEDARKAQVERERRDRERQQLASKVNAILVDGDALFQKGQVAEPAGNNALKRYRDALKVDPESEEAKARIEKAYAYYVDRGDQARDGGDYWTALENYRKASRAAEGKNEDIEARVHETETRLRSGMSGSDTPLVIYKDEKGQTVVLDDMEKVPARYRDRAVSVIPKEGQKGGGGVRR